MRYPRQHADVVALVDQMIGGITEYADKFPSCNAPLLQADRDQFDQVCSALTNAQAQVAIIAAQKLEIFKKMERDMKCQIKLGTVDNVNAIENLSLIGWGTKRAPQQIDIPGSPSGLKLIAQTDDTLFLNWHKPRNGGPIRIYEIERRQFSGSEWSDWSLTENALNNEAKLVKQPTGIKLEYRIKAVNSSGESMPSNTVAVVL